MKNKKKKKEKIKFIKKIIIAVGLLALSACGMKDNKEDDYAEENQIEQEIAEEEMENNTKETETENNSLEKEARENEEEPEVEEPEIETARIERLEPKESLEHLFDYLYPDKNNMEISLHESEDELYYKYSLIYSSGEFSCPRILYYSFSTEDGLYQEFALYEEIWATVLGEESYKEHTHNHFVNFWYINTQSKEIIPRWVYNDEAEEDTYSRIDNDEYEAISVKYAKDNE